MHRGPGVGMSDERPLKPGEKRFIAKERVNQPKTPRGQATTTWNVYDVQRACQPVQVPGFGRVAEGFTDETSCQVEADRLEEFFQKEAQ